METVSAEQVPVSAGQRMLRFAVFLCGISSAFGIDLLGQLYWAELLLPLLTVGVVLANPPRELFANRPFRILMLGVVLMFVGYVLSDIAADTPREMYLRGWARVAALGSSAFSLCVLCHRDKRSLWWFCIGMGAGGIAANMLAGMPLSQWKLGYGEPIAYLVAGSGALLPMWMASMAIMLLGGLTILLDYRSLGVQLMLVAVAAFLRSRKVGLNQLMKNIPLLVLGFGVVAVGALYLLNASRDENLARREVSNISRIAALRIGAQAIIDSPVIGYGSWGQGTKKYADMLYDETLGDLLSVGDGTVVGDPRRGSYFSAHSQIIQAWMEGGILAAVFFLAYVVLLAKGFYRLLLNRSADYLTPLLLYIFGTNLWASLMSPFLGNQRIAIALTVAAVVMLSIEQRTLATSNSRAPVRIPAAIRPVNLMP
jgi:O-antigen ligase